MGTPREHAVYSRGALSLGGHVAELGLQSL